MYPCTVHDPHLGAVKPENRSQKPPTGRVQCIIMRRGSPDDESAPMSARNAGGPSLFPAVNSRRIQFDAVRCMRCGIPRTWLLWIGPHWVSMAWVGRAEFNGVGQLSFAKLGARKVMEAIAGLTGARRRRAGLG